MEDPNMQKGIFKSFPKNIYWECHIILFSWILFLALEIDLNIQKIQSCFKIQLTPKENIYNMFIIFGKVILFPLLINMFGQIANTTMIKSNLQVQYDSNFPNQELYFWIVMLIHSWNFLIQGLRKVLKQVQKVSNPSEFHTLI